jgi:membrane protein DedA with SNARE-associated domain
VSTRALKFLFALACFVALWLLLWFLRAEIRDLGAWGYGGVFLLAFLTNLTIVLPLPGVAVAAAAGGTLDPWLVGLAAGAGATLGDLGGYFLGASGRELAEAMTGPWGVRIEALMRRWAGPTIFTLALLPNPLFDVAGMIAGAFRYPFRRFLPLTAAGKILKMLAFAWAGRLGANWLG